VDVELLHDGRQEQHKLQAADPQQHASEAALITHPISSQLLPSKKLYIINNFKVNFYC